MNSDWSAVQAIVSTTHEETWELVIARLLLAMRSPDDAAFNEALCTARSMLGAPITAAGERGFRRAYDAVLKLHLVHDIEAIRAGALQMQAGAAKGRTLRNLFRVLNSRLDATLPTFRIREPVLSIHRTTFSLR